MDLDHFKALNDTAGHMAGDDALRRFGQVLARVARRPDDVAARYGGEEFALILPGTDRAGALEVARLVTAELAAAAVPHPKGIDGVVTVSIGATTGEPEDALTPERLITRADAGLYKAKGEGRNRAVYIVSE